MPRGKVIVVEGPEGGGKTTAAQKVAKALPDKVLYVREPGGTIIGDEIRRMLLTPGNKIVPLAEVLLFWASRVQLAHEAVIPALKAGRVVIYDRYFPSTFAYQIRARGINDLELFNTLVERACYGVAPDIFVFFDIDPEIGRSRREKRGAADRIEQEAIDFHRCVYEGYKEFFAGRLHYRIDALRSEEELFADLLSIVSEACA